MSSETRYLTYSNNNKGGTGKTFYVLGGSILSLYLLMIMGTFVTSTGSGLACPDWPLCYGTVSPPLKLSIWFEWGHRLLGGLTGIMILLSTLFVWLKYKGIPRFLTSIMVMLLFTGVLLGGITVIIEAPHLDSLARIAIVSSHLIISTLVLISLVLTLRNVTLRRSISERGLSFLLFMMVYIQVILGILVRYSRATLACPDFPLCRGEIIPSLTDYTVVLHFSHRISAMIVILLTFYILTRAFKEKADVRNALFTMGLVLLQATFGILIVLTGMFLPVVILHGATGFLLLGWLAYQSAPFLLNLLRGKVLALRGA